MSTGIKIDGEKYIGHTFRGIEIIGVYRMPTGAWGAEVKCKCGKVTKMLLRTALGLNVCTHKKRGKSSD